MSHYPTIYYGAVINPHDLLTYRALPRCLLAVSSHGFIEWIDEDVPESKIDERLAHHGSEHAHVHKLERGQFIMPGFIDTHTHAPQFPNLAVGQEYELLDWLKHYTFPTESRFCNLKYARESYEMVVRRSLDLGTTTSCYFASRHLDATKILADIAHALGQRAFIGKCSMDSEKYLPDWYRDGSAEESLEDTEKLITHIQHITRNDSHPLVHPTITPRFALGCTVELLQGLGDMANGHPTLCIQTHISENVTEVEEVKEEFGTTYAGVYERYGLLRSGTILGHGVHLEDKELDMIARTQAGVSHCPTSNFNLRSGIANIGKYLDRGIKVGLGTDVSGGFSPSMLVAIRNASIASKVMAFLPVLCPHAKHSDSMTVAKHHFSNKQFSVATLLYLSTLGGAGLCNLQDQVGSFVPGKSFDALIISVRRDAGNPEIWYERDDTLEMVLERFLYCGDDRNVLKVFVQGKLVGGADYHRS